MSTIITVTSPPASAGLFTSPLLVDGWTEAVESRNIINPIVGGGVDVTLASAAKRTGSFVLLYGSEDEANAAFYLHTLPATFNLSDSDRPTVDLTYVLSGSLERTLDEESRVLWFVTVNYQEV